MSGHSDFGIFNNFGASSIFTWVKADTASAACPAHPGSLDMISITFAAVTWDADFVSFHAEIFSNFSHSLPTAAFAA